MCVVGETSSSTGPVRAGSLKKGDYGDRRTNAYAQTACALDTHYEVLIFFIFTSSCSWSAALQNCFYVILQSKYNAPDLTNTKPQTRSRQLTHCLNQTGKHGRGKVKFTGIDIFTGWFLSPFLHRRVRLTVHKRKSCISSHPIYVLKQLK